MILYVLDPGRLQLAVVFDDIRLAENRAIEALNSDPTASLYRFAIPASRFAPGVFCSRYAITAHRWESDVLLQDLPIKVLEVVRARALLPSRLE